MTDRELLELAAKAASIDAEWDDDSPDLRAARHDIYHALARIRCGVSYCPTVYFQVPPLR